MRFSRITSTSSAIDTRLDTRRSTGGSALHGSSVLIAIVLDVELDCSDPFFVGTHGLPPGQSKRTFAPRNHHLHYSTSCGSRYSCPVVTRARISPENARTFTRAAPPSYMKFHVAMDSM